MSLVFFRRVRRSVIVGAAVASSLMAAGAHYVVAPGDTLSSIASLNGVGVAELAAANQIPDLDTIRAGQQLLVPTDAQPASVGDSHQSHVVKRGESVAGIAADHGITVEQLETANGIIGGVIYSGTSLRLSGAGFIAQTGGSTLHTVAEEDTLAHVAGHHGTNAHDLAHANAISENTPLPAGTVLNVPVAWRCPVDGADYFNDWGFPRSGGRSHTGTDLVAPRGTPVWAPATGVVEQVTGSIGGHQFTLRADDGTVYLGTHMDAFGTAGRVEAGTIIGYVGDSGNAEGTDPHLHFQIHPGGGQAVNPYPSLHFNDC